MRKFKTKFYILLCSLLALSTLIIILLSIWFWQWRGELAERLQAKKFMPPTEFYSAPESFLVGQNTKEQVLAALQLRLYQRSAQEQLSPGQYLILNAENCAKAVPVTVKTEAQECWLLQRAWTKDPELKGQSHLWMAFDSKGLLVQAAAGNPLQEMTQISIEPILMAQYIGQEPILQSMAPLGQIPTQCLNAVMAIEDAHYLEHSGISTLGLLRAVYKNVLGRGYAQGGSTITQQLVKNYFLTPEKTLSRKAKEIAMALALEGFISKDQIFETYLNIIYLGQSGTFQIRGFPAAARYYFNKPIEELNLAECAMMAALLNNPGQLNPHTKPVPARKRRSLVLKKMLDANFITEADRIDAESAALPTKIALNISETAPYYFDFVRKELESQSIDPAGKSIFTGLNPNAQQIAQSSVRQHLDQLEQTQKKVMKLKASGQTLEGILLSANNKTGLIEAIVGGRSFKISQFNRAYEAHRQVGSIMKPIVFLTALAQSPKDYSPLTELSDTRMSISYQGQTWSPENYEQKYFGNVPMYVALKNSLNCATASLGWKIGLDNIVTTAKKLGIESELKPFPSLTLGAFEVKPYEVLDAYQTIARFGRHKKPTSVRTIIDDKEEVIPWTWSANAEGEQVIDANVTAELVSMMNQVTISGSGRMIKASGYAPMAAGKTGTTSDNKDAWFGGFTDSTTTVAWVGYDNNLTHGLTGTSGAVPIWLNFMKQAHPNDAVEFQWPSGVRNEEHKFEHNGSVESARLKMLVNP